MSQEDEDFVSRRNVKRFTHLLSSEVDPQKRATLKSLLRKERAKLGIG